MSISKLLQKFTIKVAEVGEKFPSVGQVKTNITAITNVLKKDIAVVTDKVSNHIAKKAINSVIDQAKNKINEWKK